MEELLIALISLILSAAISENQMQEQNKRTAHDTQVRSWFQALKDKFGISMDQLSQLASNMDIQLNRLTEAARGSARIARASQIYRDYVRKYPEKINKINAAKNQIQRAANNLSSKEEEFSARIQKGSRVGKEDIAGAALQDVKDVKNTINEINTELSDNNSSSGEKPVNTNEIDTTLKQAPDKPKDPLAGLSGAHFGWR